MKDQAQVEEVGQGLTKLHCTVVYSCLSVYNLHIFFFFGWKGKVCLDGWGVVYCIDINIDAYVCIISSVGVE